MLGSEYANVLAQIRRKVNKNWSWPSAEGGFVLLLEPCPNEDQVRRLTIPLSSRNSEGPILAASGYLAKAGFSYGLSSEEWKAGIRILGTREAVTDRRSTFIYRPYEVLGIAMGISHYEAADSRLRDWLCQLIDNVSGIYVEEPTWKRNVIAAAKAEIGHKATLCDPGQENAVEIAYWLVLCELCAWHERISDSAKWEYLQKLLQVVIQEHVECRGAGQAAAIYSAVSSAIRDLVSVAIDDRLNPAKRQNIREMSGQLIDLERSVERVKSRIRLWGSRYTKILRVLLIPCSIVLVVLPLIPLYNWMVELGILVGRYKVAAACGLVALVAYAFIWHWPKSPARWLPEKFGKWCEKHIRRRWLGDDT